MTQDTVRMYRADSTDCVCPDFFVLNIRFLASQNIGLAVKIYKPVAT